MKLVLSIVVYLLMAAALSWGILLLMAGKPLLLIVAFLVFLIGLVKIGCLSH